LISSVDFHDNLVSNLNHLRNINIYDNEDILPNCWACISRKETKKFIFISLFYFYFCYV